MKAFLLVWLTGLAQFSSGAPTLRGSRQLQFSTPIAGYVPGSQVTDHVSCFVS